MSEQERSAYERLDPKRRRFVDAFLGEAKFCATKAAEIAKYADPRRSGSAVKRQLLVKEAIEAQLDELAMSGREVLARLTDIARGSIADFIRINPGGTWTLDLEKAERAGMLHILAELQMTEFGPRFSLHSPVQALSLLGKHHGLFTEKHEVELRDDSAAHTLDRKLASLAASVGAASVPSEADAAGSGGA